MSHMIYCLDHHQTDKQVSPKRSEMFFSSFSHDAVWAPSVAWRFSICRRSGRVAEVTLWLSSWFLVSPSCNLWSTSNTHIMNYCANINCKLHLGFLRQKTVPKSKRHFLRQSLEQFEERVGIPVFWLPAAAHWSPLSGNLLSWPAAAQLSAKLSSDLPPEYESK